jgi:adenosylmethionine-8-amino-7-oxononanoate aminotransferase
MMEWLEDVLDTCTYHGFSVAFEFKDASWFQDLTYLNGLVDEVYERIKRHGYMFRTIGAVTIIHPMYYCMEYTIGYLCQAVVAIIIERVIWFVVTGGIKVI